MHSYGPTQTSVEWSHAPHESVKLNRVIISFSMGAFFLGGIFGGHGNARKYTPPKLIIAPEKWWLEDDFPIGKLNFQGLC